MSRSDREGRANGSGMFGIAVRGRGRDLGNILYFPVSARWCFLVYPNIFSDASWIHVLAGQFRCGRSMKKWTDRPWLFLLVQLEHSFSTNPVPLVESHKESEMTRKISCDEFPV